MALISSSNIHTPVSAKRNGNSDDRGRIAGPVILLLMALAMLFASWGGWPDPLVDFGAQLYVPWRLVSGQVLYRDIAYFNGPLSSYLNATMFFIAGVSLRTLVLTNLLILAGVMIVAYRLTARATNRFTAFMGGAVFIAMFGFGQLVLIGNYNWVTPYTHELTHGTALGLVAIACANRCLRKRQRRWLALCGLCLGAVFLTKAEPTAASFLAVAAQLLAWWWMNRLPWKATLKACLLLVVATLVCPLMAGLLLGTAMPSALAWRGVMGSWPWVFDRRVTGLMFYQNVTGLNDIAQNLRTMIEWFAGYGVVVAIAVACSFVNSAGRVLVLLGATITIGVCFQRINWTGMVTPLPMCLFIAGLFTLLAVMRAKQEPCRAALRLSLTCFAGVLVAKMGLKPHVYHYGFVLAWPGTVVLIAAMTQGIPAYVHRRGGNGAAVSHFGMVCVSVGAIVVLRQDYFQFQSKQWTVYPDTPDAFIASSCGLEVQRACDQINQLIPPGGTVAVFPQGLMINYLTRRASPIHSVNFMPPEVLAAGETNILKDLSQHPPDVIVITSTVIQNHQFTLDGHDDWGGDTLRWIMQNYVQRNKVVLEPGLPTIYSFILAVPKPPKVPAAAFRQP